MNAPLKMQACDEESTVFSIWFCMDLEVHEMLSSHIDVSLSISKGVFLRSNSIKIKELWIVKMTSV